MAEEEEEAEKEQEVATEALEREVLEHLSEILARRFDEVELLRTEAQGPRASHVAWGSRLTLALVRAHPVLFLTCLGFVISRGRPCARAGNQLDPRAGPLGPPGGQFACERRARAGR